MAAKLADVTIAQAMEVRSMAVAKGVGKPDFQQYGLSGGIIAAALDEVKQKAFIGDLTPPPGGRLHALRVPVILDRDWQEAVNAAGPDTPDDDNVRKVGDLYLPTGEGTVEEEIILLNFSSDGSWDKAISWAENRGLKRTDPRCGVFAIGEHKPNLHRELGIDPMYVVATEECAFAGYRRAVCVWWDGARRGAYLYLIVVDFDDSRAWYAFGC